MRLRPQGPVPALVALSASAVFLFLAVYLVDHANRDMMFRYDFPEVSVYEVALAWGGAMFLLSMAAAVMAVVLWIVQPPRTLEVPEAYVDAPMAPAVGLVEMAGGFVQRLHGLMLMTGILLAAGGSGLVATASLVADGTFYGPFPIPGRIWVVRLDTWQVHVTVWSILLLALALTFWASEYRSMRRLRAAWNAPAPEV